MQVEPTMLWPSGQVWQFAAAAVLTHEPVSMDLINLTFYIDTRGMEYHRQH